MESVKEEIEKLKKEKKAVILAHYYVPGEVQEIADYIGDSYFLSKKARETDAEVILFAGVSFMGESAKILNPERIVLLPDPQADCPMAHMALPEKIQEMRNRYEDLAVVCYINSSARLKTMSDVCVTSSNAVDIVRKLPNRNIFFVPDGNLGAYVAAQIPEKNVILNNGYCPVHREITREDVEKARKDHPAALVLVHPECTAEVVRRADFVGSTSEIINFACQSEKKEFLIGTEEGVMWELERKCSGKIFYPVKSGQCCQDMKKVTLEKVREAMKEEKYQVILDEETARKARLPLDKMLELGK